MFGLIASLRLVIAIVKPIILDKLKSFRQAFVNVVDPCNIDDLILFDIEEWTWDAANRLRIAAISAIPRSCVSTVVELGIVAFNSFCSFYPNYVFVNVILTITFRKFLQLL